MFYDCEDSPTDFYPGVGYEALKNKCVSYAKMNWVDDDRNDNIKNIGFHKKRRYRWRVVITGRIGEILARRKIKTNFS